MNTSCTICESRDPFKAKKTVCGGWYKTKYINIHSILRFWSLSFEFSLLDLTLNFLTLTSTDPHLTCT